ncbi:MAG: DUF929 family protein [Candidatus Micrarchaeota archaeon]|nr:DUF929 family protein [Candidatus Micrarchaeota archaeon]MDE1859275.1 DUF929 family protein [Candidatus Micrarchaeota archaeon]
MNKTKLYALLAVIIVLIIVILVIYLPSTKNNNVIESQVGNPVPQSVINQLMIPNSVSNKIGIGGVSEFPLKANSTVRLVNNSKPEVLYIGAEYCPYCAITRWGMIIALLKFGTFTNLHYMASNATDVFPDTPTFTFYNSTYQSNYITFISVEQTTRNHNVNLQTPTASEQSIYSFYDLNNPQLPSTARGGIPFIDFGNVSIQAGSPEFPVALEGQTWNSTIANLTKTNSSVSQALVGSADVFTAAICQMTNNTPSDVCNQPYVSSIQTTYLG